MDTCFRDTEESLIGYRKNTGNPLTVMTRIDAAEGETDCDDVDQTTHIEVSGDGTQFYASFDSGGLWRIRPSPLEFLDTSYFEDYFRLHPDGSVVFATVKSAPTTATINLYRVTPSEVASWSGRSFLATSAGSSGSARAMTSHFDSPPCCVRSPPSKVWCSAGTG